MACGCLRSCLRRNKFLCWGDRNSHHEVSMSLRSPTEHENGWHSQNMLPSSIRHSRARGNPGLFCAELAWIPAFAGMTEPRWLFVVDIIPSQVFSKEARRTRRCRIRDIPNFVLFVISFENTCATMICASITTLCSVIPAQAGIHPPSRPWMPACAGMTSLRNELSGGGFRYFHDL